MELFLKALGEHQKPAGSSTDDVSTPARQPGQSAAMKEAAGGAAPTKPFSKPAGDKKDDDDEEPMALD